MSLKYKIKEIYFTLQGEGYHSGRPAIFCRFSGCNLWSGREEDREKAICSFCDTDFVGTNGVLGGKYTLEELLACFSTLWPGPDPSPGFVVFTGGEPLLQMDNDLVQGVKAAGFEIAVETNGTLMPSFIADEVWITVSPKAGSDVLLRSGDELKLVYPQILTDPASYITWDFEHFYLQPLDDEAIEEHTAICVRYCKEHPRWSISLQTHKILGIK